MGPTAVRTIDGCAPSLGSTGYMMVYTPAQSGRKSREFKNGEPGPTQNGISQKPDHESQAAQLDKPAHPVHLNRVATNQDAEEEGPQPILLMVSEPGVPSCKEPIVPSHLELSWMPSISTATVGELEPGVSAPEIDIGYSLEMQEVASSALESIDSGKWKECLKCVTPNAKVDGLRPGRHYAVRVICTPVPLDNDLRFKVEAESSFISGAAIFFTPRMPPSRPEPPIRSGKDKRELTVRWKVPAEVGGAGIRIDEYVVEARPSDGTPLPGFQESSDGFYVIYKGPDAAKQRIKQLRPGADYEFRVKARNCMGESDWSPTVTYRTDAAVPSQPSPPQVTCLSPTSASVSWTPPDDNGAKILEYVLESAIFEGNNPTSLFNVQYRGLACEALCDKLQSGTDYHFRVAAYNEAGKSPYSLPYTHIKTMALGPKAPGPPKVLGRNRTTVTLEWKPPEDDGGSPVTLYQLELQPHCKAAMESLEKDWLLVFEGPSTAHTQESLRPGCNYQVRVRARNMAGFGDYSRAIVISTAPDVPFSPAMPRCVFRSLTSLSLEWAPPSHDGGLPVTSYRLEVAPLRRSDEGSGDGPPSVNRAKFSTWQLADGGMERRANLEGPMPAAFPQGLEPGTWYAFRVFAVNAEGASSPSPIGTAVTKPAPPLQPGEPRCQGPMAPTSLNLAWDEPVKRGSAITSYTLEICLASDFLPAAAPPEEPPQPEPQESSGPIEEDSESLEDTKEFEQSKETPPLPEPSPMLPEPTVPQETSPFTVAYTGAARTCEVKGLEPYTEYAVRLKASSAAGLSEWGPVAIIHTGHSVPSPPQNLKAEGEGEDTISAVWEPPLRDNGCAVVDYTLEMASGGVRGKPLVWRKVYQGPYTTYQVMELRPAREYQLRVRASNARGQSPWSDTTAARTYAAAPEAPAAPVCSKRTARSQLVKWEPPLQDNGAVVKRYRLLMAENEGGPFTQVFAGSQTSTQVKDLQPDTTYWFQVIANNGIGDSPPSEAASGCTSLLPPDKPASVTAVCSGTEGGNRRPSIAVSWEAAQSAWPNAEVGSHEVQALDSSTSQQLKATCGKVDSCEVTGVLPGHDYQVRVRRVGAAGAGHSDWSESVCVKIPGVPLSDLSALTVVPKAAPAEVARHLALVQQRQTRKVREPDSRQKTTEKKAGVSAGKKPPRSRSWNLRQLLKYSINVVLIALGIAFVVLIFVLALQDFGTKRPKFP